MEWVTLRDWVKMAVPMLLIFLHFPLPFSPLPFLLHVCQDTNAQTDADASVPRSAMQAE